MNKVKGVVEKVFQRGKFYSVKVGEDWYGCGMKAPTCAEGDTVEFTAEKNDKGYMNVKGSVSVVGAGTSASSSGGGAALPPNSREVSILHQSARKDAIALLPVMFEQGAVSLPTKKDAKYDALLALVEEVTNNFYLSTQECIKAGGVKLEDVIPAPGDGDSDSDDF